MCSSRARQKARLEADMDLVKAAIRLGEAFPWPDRISAAVIDA
jgi:hypothetical protein